LAPPSGHNRPPTHWVRAALVALPISLFILARFYGWFAVADRYAIFLYNHLGARPFDPVTRSRYWMAGLVAAGEVMVLYTVAHWCIGQIAALRDREVSPPTWWRVWTLCAPVLAVGILIITMTANSPTLPLPDALASVAATLAGLALALLPGEWAAQQPCDLAWLAADGAGLMPVLLLLRVVELPGRGLSLPFTPEMVIPIAIGAVAAGAIWLAIVTGLRLWRHRPTPGAGALLATGLALSYLLMPVVHHWLATPPGWRYITTASNFFALSPLVQAAAFLVAGAMALGITHLRCALESRCAGTRPN
jgi:hypothetical protein